MIQPDTDLETITHTGPSIERGESPEASAPPKPGHTAGHGIQVEGLNAYYGDHQVIKGMNVAFAPNHISAIIGPSGSGKSTVVRCINRMHEEIPKARATGSVRLDDVDIYSPDVDVVTVRRTIGMVFQKPNPFPTMSIFDNVAAGLRLSGTRGGHLRER